VQQQAALPELSFNFVAISLEMIMLGISVREFRLKIIFPV
jgi:hypothetical protein